MTLLLTLQDHNSLHHYQRWKRNEFKAFGDHFDPEVEILDFTSFNQIFQIVFYLRQITEDFR